MSDHIDQSQWLPRNTSVINSYRVKHTDIKGEVTGEGSDKRISYAEVADCSIMAHLIGEGYLEQFHRWYGLTLMELALGFAGPMGYKINSALLSDAFGGTVSRKHAGRMYDDIMRQIKMNGKRVIERACNDDYTPMPPEAKNAIRECFEYLVLVTDQVISTIKAEIEKELADA